MAKMKKFYMLASAIAILIFLVLGWGASRIDVQKCVSCRQNNEKNTYINRSKDNHWSWLEFNQLYDFSFCKKKRILLYTELFERKIWPHIPVNYNFTDLDGSPCPINHCEITYNRSEVQTVDVVFSHGRDLPPASTMHATRRRYHNPEQLWIYFIHESPMFTYHNSVDYNDLFNWTASYRTESEVFIPYFTITRLGLHDVKEESRNYAQGKPNLVLYINSHCDDLRMTFIKKLKAYASVDVYGGCGHIFNPNAPPCPRRSAECTKLKQTYKFYLAFENSFCIDYITEKYYKDGLLQGLVPIVFGGANYSKTQLTAPNSFIDGSAFRSVKDLADYLNYLDKNDTAYNMYFQWRQTHKVELRHGMCKLCKALWDTTISRRKRTVDLPKFWGQKSSCVDRKDKLKHLL